MTIAQALLLSAALLLFTQSHSSAAVVLGFVPDKTEAVIGETIDVAIVLTQDTPADLDSLLDDDGVTAFSVPFSLSGSAFSVSSFAVDPAFPDASSTSSVLQGFSFGPVYRETQ